MPGAADDYAGKNDGSGNFTGASTQAGAKSAGMPYQGNTNTGNTDNAAVDPHQVAKDKRGRGGGGMPQTPQIPFGIAASKVASAWPGPGGMPGMPPSQPAPYNPLSSLPVQTGPVAPPMGMTAEQAAQQRAAAAQPVPIPSASNGQGSPWHHNAVANLVGTGPGQYATYDQAIAGLSQPQDPGGPPVMEEQGGGGGRGGGGGGGRGGQDTGVPTAPGGGDTASLIAQLSRDQGGRIFKMDGNLRGILASLGRAPQFTALLQSLGFGPIGQINADGFYNDWIVPTNLQMTPEYMAMLQTLDPVDQISLQMMLGQLFGLQAGGQVPGAQVPGQIPGMETSAPLMPGQGDFGMPIQPETGIPFAPDKRAPFPMPGGPGMDQTAPLMPGQGDFGMPPLPGGPGVVMPGLPKR